MINIQFNNLLSYREIGHFVSADNMSLFTQDGVNNRQEYAKKFGFDIQRAVSAEQVHKNNVAIITDDFAGCGGIDASTRIQNCDALVTNKKGIALFIMTADCVPVILYSPDKEVVAAIHAGWRGTAQNIVDATIRQMIETYKVNPNNIIAAIGPSIQSCCFEVGDDVVKSIGNEYVAKKKENGKQMYNLPLANYNQLIKSGVKSKNIELSKICTCCNSNWPSWRRNKTTDRIASVIWLK